MIPNPRALAFLVAAVVAVVGTWAVRGVWTSPGDDVRQAHFASNSPWRVLISADPEIDPGSAAMIAAISSPPALHANLVEFAIPIYTVDADTPTHRVSCTAEWGICPFAGWPVPIPDGASPHTGSDGAMVTVDESAGTSFEFWRAAADDGRWSVSWGAVNSARGSGWGGESTGSGASRLAGVIRLSEIEAGVIPHALALQSSSACESFRPPALKSDGRSPSSDCIPQGARLQLDPDLNLAELDLSPGERAVATAMQQYGGYLMDVAATPLSVSFELDTSAAPGTLGEIHQKAGFRWDYDAMENVPWSQLRVLT